MILKLAKRGDGQNNKAYAKAVLEYIARPTITEKLVSGHKAQEVENCTYFSIHGNTPSLTLQEQAREFGMIANGADSRAKDVLRHYIISWPKGQEPTHEQVEMSARMFLEGIGHNPESAQWAVGLHVNTQHKHMHIFVNRVNPETGNLTREGGGWWVREGLKALARIEYTFGWKPEKHSLYHWNPVTGVADKIRKAKPKEDRVSDRARRLELEKGVKSNERILKEFCSKIRDMIASVLPEKRSWADFHRSLAAVGVEYIRAEDKKGATVFVDGKTFYAASVVADDFSLKSMEKMIGSTYRSPRETDVNEMEKMRKEARKKLFAAPIPLPQRLMSARHKKHYLDDWARYKLRQQRDNFQLQNCKFSVLKNQPAHAPR